jgi:hypothetical protein
MINPEDFMRSTTRILANLMSLIGLLIGLMVLAFDVSADERHQSDVLYIGDGGDDSVKRFNAKTGAFLGHLVEPGIGRLHGPRGLVFIGGKLAVVNQNVETPFNGEVLQYRKESGDFLGALVSASDPDAPFVPRGLIRGPGRTLYLADFDFGNGRVAQFDVRNGKFLRNLDTTGFTGRFIPRGLVQGPDGLLYVSVTGNLAEGDGLTGSVLRFNPRDGRFIDVFTSNLAAAGQGLCAALHRPEGLVFGPDDKLYITSFRANVDDTDKILIVNGETGHCTGHIELAPAESTPGVGAAGRAFAQALVFGPDGHLFVPINGPREGISGPVTGIHTGEVRRYNVKTKAFKVFVPSAAQGGPLEEPWYLTFGQTNSRTLEYDD